MNFYKLFEIINNTSPFRKFAAEKQYKLNWERHPLYNKGNSVWGGVGWQDDTETFEIVPSNTESGVWYLLQPHEVGLTRGNKGQPILRSSSNIDELKRYADQYVDVNKLSMTNQSNQNDRDSIQTLA